ncbi:MAG: hypothetical protein OER88_00710 [Planctomycetota bacterium]|nr:hypothetical protein [Planctomycetota bacterium]
MGNAGKALLAAAAFGAALWIGWEFVRPPPSFEPGPGSDKTTPQRADAPHAALRRRLAGAGDTTAPDLLREALATVTTASEKQALGVLIRERGDQALRALRSRVDDACSSFRYETARREVARYARAWRELAPAAAMQAVGKEIAVEAQTQIDQRIDEAELLLRGDRLDAAREALDVELELGEALTLRWIEARAATERRIRVRRWELSKGDRPRPPPTGAGAATTTASGLAPPPALPGYPHTDVKRMGEAKVVLNKARGAFQSGRYREAAKSLEELQGFFGDLEFVSRRREGIAAVAALARYRASGVRGLFNATKVERKGARVTLHYDFASPSELADWESLKLLAHKDDGEFRALKNGVQGSGVAWLIHRAFFTGPVSIRCKVAANVPKTHGLVLCQEGLETRHFMWVVSNQWLVEGENYVKARPGHSLLMFGKGVNRDVPVESPEVGFIFRGASIDEPQPRQGETYSISFSWGKDRMRGTIKTRYGKGEREDIATGDDGRGISRLRPGLAVVQTAVTFKEIVIQGRLHPEFERKRVDDLLQLASLLD